MILYWKLPCHPKRLCLLYLVKETELFDGLASLMADSGFVQVLEVLESTWNSSLVFQGLEILEKQHFFGQGALKSLNLFYITNHMISHRVQLRLQWNFFYKIHSVLCLRHSQFCDNLLKSLSIKKEWSWKTLNLVLESPWKVLDIYV